MDLKDVMPWASPTFYRAFLEALPIPVFVIDQGHRFKYANPAFLDIFGLPANALLGRTLWEYWPEEESKFFKQACDDVFANHQAVTTEFESADDHTFHEITLSWWDSHVSGAIIDVTTQRRREGLIQEELDSTQRLVQTYEDVVPAALQSASTDSLTGLPNRRRADDIGPSVFRAMQCSGMGAALCLIDLDNFKSINDTFGHAEGDNVLRRVGSCLSEVKLESETAARIGGEEFVLICPCTDLDQAMARAECVLKAIRSIRETSRPVTASIGVSWMFDLNDTWEQALARADQALYQAKNAGRNQAFGWIGDAVAIDAA